MDRKIVVGFWIRFFSDILDCLFVGLFGFLISIPLGQVFYVLGDSALLIGIVIVFLYNGILQSGRGYGQTIAKMVFKIEVRRLDGSYLGLARSFVRYGLIAVLFYNQLFFTGIISVFPFLDNETFRVVYMMVVVSLFMTNAVLIAVHPLKQGLQDLLVGSIVVRANTYSPEAVGRLQDSSREARAVLVCAVVLIVLVTGQFMMFQNSVAWRPTIEQLLTQKRLIEKETYLIKVMPRLLMGNTPQEEGSAREWSVLMVEAFLPKILFDDEVYRKAQAQEAVDILVKNYPNVAECDYLGIKVRTGFDIGIWSQFEASKYFFESNGKPKETPKE